MGKSEIIISIDAMGGDVGPGVVIPGLKLALERRPDVKFLIFGQEKEIEEHLQHYPQVAAISNVQHCDVMVQMDDKPSQALRRGRRHSSMWRAIEAVKSGQARACVSAGNTGALMAMSKVCLQTMANIDRPAIAGIWPTIRGESIVLDMGATVGANATQLIDFSILGGAMCRALFDIDCPKIGLLNIGVEEVKGLEEIRKAGRLLREIKFETLDYHGFVEGTDIGQGTVDVVVTEGFSGNIALKAAEGTARQIATYLRSAMERSWRTKIGYLFARPAFDALRKKLDIRHSNGGVFLGLNGIVVKSHGGTDKLGFAAAVDMAYDVLCNDLEMKIARDLKHFHSDINHKKVLDMGAVSP